ncbi:MAG TPA: protease pro-enzyme activation domain-containing protein [Streptosporangiaceae bacterium]
MSRLRMLVAATGATAAVIGMTAGASGLAQASPRPSETMLAGSAASFTSGTPATGDVAAATRLTVQLWLKPDTAAAERYAVAVSTPGSRTFRHFLSPAAYTARFGATKATAGRVESWLRSQGFTAVRTDAQRSYVRATASAATINAAFRVQLKTYQRSKSVNAGPYALRANDRAVSLPSSLAGRVLGVTGLDNQAAIQPLDAPGAAPARVKTTAKASAGPPCSDYYGQQMATGLPEQFGTTSFPTFICGYTGAQMRAAYRASPAITGKGQTVALVELGLTRDMFATLQDYAAANGVAAPSSERYAELSLGANSCGDPFDLEEQLDVEASYDMAPGANQLVVGGDSCNNGDFGLQGLFDADIAVIDGADGHPLATAASNSWESGGTRQPASISKIEHAYLVRSAAEGVGMYFSAGDGSGVLLPSADPFAIAVGGTSLGIGQAGNRLFETGWSTGDSLIKNGKWVLKGEDGASGGGNNTLYAQPAYQNGVVPASLGTDRSAPDIAASADAFTGMALGLLAFKAGSPPAYHQIPIGGTSESAPLVAGIVIAAQQGQSEPFGFINPAIYRLAGTSAFFDTLPLTDSSPALYRGVECDVLLFANICGNPPVQNLTTFDDQSPQMRGYTGQVTLPGYDNMTGLGAPDGPKFIAALRKVDG